MDTDMMIRMRAFDWLAEQVESHGDKRLILPRAPADWPGPELLDWRYEQFLKAA